MTMCITAASTVTVLGNEWRVMTHTAVYNTSRWRELPRDYCIAEYLFGDAVGPCAGLIHHHHVDPTDPDSRTVQVCQAHHPKIHKILRGLAPRRRRCTHNHRYDHARRECERRLNATR